MITYDENSAQAKIGNAAHQYFCDYLDSLGISHSHPGCYSYGPDKGDVLLGNGVMIDVKTQKKIENHNWCIKDRQDFAPDFYVLIDYNGLGKYEIIGACSQQTYLKTRSMRNGYNLLWRKYADKKLLMEIIND